MRPLIHNRHHYDNDNDSMIIGQGQKEKCKRSHLPILPEEERNSFFFCLAPGWYFAD